uniref:HTH_48 domain-containing protein n=1 Tax=Heterorhabditis bacteriophora TaxID=37862 RepID=A0A1I7XFJ0_HETBA
MRTEIQIQAKQFLSISCQIKNGKKQIKTILLYEFKIENKAVETALIINQETVDQRTARYWFQKFCNGGESLEDEDGRGHSLVNDDSQLRAIIEADPCKTTQEVAEELNVDNSTVVRHLH